MTKAEFINAFKKALPDIFANKAEAESAYLTFCSILAEAAATETGTRLPKVGTLSVTQRAARTGRNPRTGQAVHIPARKSVKFTPARSLTDRVRIQ